MISLFDGEAPWRSVRVSPRKRSIDDAGRYGDVPDDLAPYTSE
jgi:hypothetical protein